jgi:hypothetical protein
MSLTAPSPGLARSANSHPLPCLALSSHCFCFLPAVSLTCFVFSCLTPSPSRLPAEYKQLESRVDALRDVHQKLLKITKVHETESVSQQCLI